MTRCGRWSGGTSGTAHACHGSRCNGQSAEQPSRSLRCTGRRCPKFIQHLQGGTLCVGLTPERLHTWSLHGAGLGSGTAQGVCEEAPKSFHNDTQEQLDQGPDCFGLKDKSSEEIGERAS